MPINLVDTFHNRIMFPTNDQGKVIAFSGRIWQKTDSHKLSIKIVDRLQFLTKVTNYIIWIGQKSSGKVSEIYLMEGFMMSLQPIGLESKMLWRLWERPES